MTPARMVWYTEVPAPGRGPRVWFVGTIRTYLVYFRLLVGWLGWDGWVDGWIPLPMHMHISAIPCCDSVIQLPSFLSWQARARPASQQGVFGVGSGRTRLAPGVQIRTEWGWRGRVVRYVLCNIDT